MTFYLPFHIIFIQYVFVYSLLDQFIFLSEWIFMPHSLSHLYLHQHTNLTSINQSVIYVNKFQPFSCSVNIPDDVICDCIKKQLG